MVARLGEGGFRESCVDGRQVTATMCFGGSRWREGCTRPTASVRGTCLCYSYHKQLSVSRRCFVVLRCSCPVLSFRSWSFILLLFLLYFFVLSHYSPGGRTTSFLFLRSITYQVLFCFFLNLFLCLCSLCREGGFRE